MNRSVQRVSAWLITFVVALGVLVVNPAAMPASSGQQAGAELVALDVALQPDSAALAQIQGGISRLMRDSRLPVNQRLEIGAAPRITLVQRFVRSRDLDAIAAALGKIAAASGTLPIRLTASGYSSADAGSSALVVLTLDPSPELDRLARAVVDAVQPFAGAGGSAAAFIRTPAEEIDAITIRTVEEFVPRLSGSNYVPYLSLGLAHPEFVKVLRDASFDRLRFNGVNLVTYQLGRFGTAQKRLWGSGPAGTGKSGS